MFRTLIGLTALMWAGTACALESPEEWSRPTAPFHIAGPVYYVGTEGIGIYLFDTGSGLILLDGGLAESVASVERSVQTLGFRLRDIKLIVATHAHFDHAGALAQLKRDTGARFYASAADRGAYETGTPPSDVDYGVVRFAPVKVDGTLVDGRAIKLGRVALVPLLTPGHTPGCTSWALHVREAGRTMKVVFPCSLTVAGNKLHNNRGYPGIVRDFRRTFARVRTWKADIVLPAHPDFADVLGRARRQRMGEKNAFIAPDLLPSMVAKAEADFSTELARQEASK